MAAAVVTAVVGTVAIVLILPQPGSMGGCNEAAAVSALRTYLSAQNQFCRVDHYGTGQLVYANPTDGVGFPDLYAIGGPGSDGRQLKLIDFAFARATPSGTSRAGYLFCDIIGRAGVGPYDYTKECGLCAFPAEYNVTGRNTFIIDETGIVYQKFMGGKPVTKWPGIEAEGWVPVGSE